MFWFESYYVISFHDDLTHDTVYASRMWKGDFVLTSLFAMGVLSSPGRCCSKARTTQLAVMVARIMYSNGVKAAKVKESTLSATHGRNQTTKIWANNANKNMEKHN